MDILKSFLFWFGEPLFTWGQKLTGGEQVWLRLLLIPLVYLLAWLLILFGSRQSHSDR